MTTSVPPNSAAAAPPDDALRYPTGRLAFPAAFDAEWRRTAVQAVVDTPATLRAAVDGWTDAQLDTPYRPGGWTGRQLIHHLADSHMNAYVRFKLALTEDEPTIKPYDEAAWALLPDSALVPVEVSLQLVDGIHARWAAILHAMREEDYARALIHPENGRRTLDQMLATYAWHGRHHVAHLTGLATRSGWAA